MYIGHAALGTKMYPGLYAPGTRGHADLGVGNVHGQNIIDDWESTLIEHDREYTWNVQAAMWWGGWPTGF